VALLLVSILSVGRFGLLWVCTAVGLSYAAYTIANLMLVHRIDRLALRTVSRNIGGPFAACVAMVAAILLSRSAMQSAPPPAWLALAAEIVIGGLAYIGAALAVCPALLRELLRLAASASRGYRQTAQ
jgi:hypothetical protein